MSDLYVIRKFGTSSRPPVTRLLIAIPAISATSDVRVCPAAFDSVERIMSIFHDCFIHRKMELASLSHYTNKTRKK